MSSVQQKVVALAKDRKFTLDRGEHIFERILVRNPKFIVYDTQNREEPLFTISEEDFEKKWTHSTVVRVTKLPDDEQKIKALFDQFDVRKEIDSKACPDVIPFYDQGLIQYGQDIFYATRYDDPCRDFSYWLSIDHQGLELDSLDAYRLARGTLEAFKYLEENGFVLTQFDERNLYVGSFSEDRGNYFRILFKGHKDKSAPINALQRRHRFSPPETQTTDIYKSYSFSVGLMIIYATLATFNKADKFPNNLYQDTGKIPELIKLTVENLHNKGNTEHKELARVFLEDILETNVEKRRTIKNLLNYKWIRECAVLDYAEYEAEVKDNEAAKQREKQEEEKNKFA